MTAGLLDGVDGLIAGPRNASIERAKSSGRGIVGYFCSYLPVELITAADMVPVRLRGAGSLDSGPADVFMSSRTCTYVRHTLAMVLRGEYDFLDGAVCLNTCDHVRRAFDLFRHKSKVKFQGFISVPRNARESLYPYYRQEVENLRSAIEKHFEVEIGPDQLRRAIALHNRVRARLGQFDLLRAEDEAPIGGADLLMATVAAAVMAPEDFLSRSDEWLGKIQQEDKLPKPRARLILAGGELDEPGWVALIENLGARVVGDTLCTGMRAQQSPACEDGDDPLEAICRRYFFQVSCARMIGNFPDRYESLMRAVHERSADGIIFQRLQFCDPWGGDAHNLRQRARQDGIPLLVLEREYGMLNSGQLKTRVQAFLEMIESRSGRRARKTDEVRIDVR
ncbi:MAG TPA: 2-hydroxyacyl-CoA dehydratase family protein [Myxococcota bacterium]|nr:2-hydroxyacyl-CoA dehydratase family protein [Myxococcota bacterium]